MNSNGVHVDNSTETRRSDEEWRKLSLVDNKYEVSDRGRVRRCVPGNGTHVGHVIKSIMKKGYWTVGLGMGKKIKWFNVHKLVAHAFIGERPEGLQVNHKDGNKLNNVPSNLEYITDIENKLHAQAMGNWPIGERHGRSKLSESDVVEIRQLMASGATTKDLAARFGVHRTIIQKIVRRSLWGNVL